MEIQHPRTFFLFLVFSLFFTAISAQNQEKLPFLQPADTLHKGRFWSSLAIGTASYGITVVGLQSAWYADSEQTKFQFFNDSGEWLHVDKAGHMFTAYNYSAVIFDGANWTGMKRRRAMWTAAGLSTILQGTIEVMDGFSEKWGFSIPDIGFNTLGVGLFVSQELLWQEQRITMKVSSTLPTYPTDVLTSVDGLHTTTYRDRAQALYGKSFLETLIKDYNAQTNWLSFNIHSFMKKKDTKFPKWLNVAIGYGAQNMYEGFGYSWTEVETEIEYARDPNLFPRTRQLYFSFDIDLKRIPTNNRFLKTAFSLLNFIKIPSPSLEFNSMGAVRFHPIYF